MSTMVRPSEAAALAIHACALLAATAGEPLPTSRMAQSLSASEAHLAKVLQRLSHEGLVTGTRGPRGGFRLAVRPESLTLRRVYEAIEGPLVVRGCLLGVPMRKDAACPLAALLARVSSELVRELEGVTVADLCTVAKDGRRARGGRSRKQNGTRAESITRSRR